MSVVCISNKLAKLGQCGRRENFKAKIFWDKTVSIEQWTVLKFLGIVQPQINISQFIWSIGPNWAKHKVIIIQVGSIQKWASALVSDFVNKRTGTILPSLDVRFCRNLLSIHSCPCQSRNLDYPLEMPNGNSWALIERHVLNHFKIDLRNFKGSKQIVLPLTDPFWIANIRPASPEVILKPTCIIGTLAKYL